MQAITTLLLGLGLFQSFAAGLQVTPNSACSALCLNDPESDASNPASSFTDPSEVTCEDPDYSESPVGIKYKNCMDCLRKSNATSQAESDTTWFLYNARYTVDVCIYGYKNESKRISTPCDINTSCKSLKQSLLVGDLDPNRNPLEYCDANGGAYSGSAVDWCAKCYSNTDETSYLANFFIALKAGCQQRPKAGALLGLSGSIFATSLVEITDPPQQDLPAQGNNSTGMTTGAIVGIAVGAGLLFLGGTGLFFVYHRKQKRLYSDFPPEYDPRGGTRMKSVTPPVPLLANPRSLAPTPDLKSGGSSIVNQRSMEDMSDYELRAQHGYTSNGAYYDRLEKEMQTRKSNVATRGFPSPPPPTLTIPMPSHPAYNPQTHSRQNSHDVLASSPPMPVKSNKPDSYALQAYLNAAQAAEEHIPAVPRTHQKAPSAGDLVQAPTPGLFNDANSPDRNPYRGAMMTEALQKPHNPKNGPLPVNPAIAKLLASSTDTQNSRAASPALSHNSTPAATNEGITPLRLPPPPPRRTTTTTNSTASTNEKSKVPSLTLPSIPRIRVPKKYAPPNITIEAATPVDGNGIQEGEAAMPTATSILTSQSRIASPTSQQGDVQIGIQIGRPLDQHPPERVPGGGVTGYYNSAIRGSDDAPQSRWKSAAQRGGR